MAGKGTRVRTSDLNIASSVPLVAPKALKLETPLQNANFATVVESREILRNIITKKDPRLIAIIGPCSIHDREAAIDYAAKLRDLRRQVMDRIYIIMRVYFEKPRTVLGWKGLITDPHLNGSYDIALGLRLAREILLEITAMGVPAGSEMLDPIVPQYIDDLISWAAIGARTTESQTHREMASGLSMPVGFKNGTDGSYEVAVNALKSSRSEHSFIGIDQNGKTSVLKTRGNPYAHIISRGGAERPNYSVDDIEEAEELMEKADLDPAILIDCSHGNSRKRAQRQERVLRGILDLKRQSVDSVIGFMLESNLFPGSQQIPADVSTLKYGISITDECVGWDDTKRMVEAAYENYVPRG